MSTTTAALKWTDIDGWLTPMEGRALQMLAVGNRVLEFGSYKGRSTVCMAQTASQIITVDHHHGDSGTGPANTWDELRANIEASGKCQDVFALRCDLSKFDPRWISRPIDLVFIDDDHDQAERSTRIALKCVKTGGVIAWHDWDYEPVQTSVRSLGIEPTGFAGTLAWWRKPEGFQLP